MLDQVLDVRDVSGSLYRINQQGGFKNATTDQVVNLGFAAFGVIPEVGSAFKTVFKPLYKQRKAAKGAIHGGMQAVESLLGMKKGGAITWVRKELIGKWAGRTKEAISATNMALTSCIELLEFIATASGWKDWLIPDSIQDMAKQMLPGLKKLRGQIGTYITRASNEIRELLEDLVGEQAAAVVMQVGQRAVQASAIPGTRTKSGHNAAALKPAGKVPPRQGKLTTGNSNTSQKKKASGSQSNTVQKTADAVLDLTNAVLGVSGEHIADYYCLDKFNWGGKAWTKHDEGAAGVWNPTPSEKVVGKLSRGGPGKTLHALYKLRDGANGKGLDSVWRAEGNNHNKPYAIVEAKASADEDAKKFDRIKKTSRQPSIASKLGVSGTVDPTDLLEPREDAGGKTGGGSGKPGGVKPGKVKTKPAGSIPAATSTQAKPKTAAPGSPTEGGPVNTPSSTTSSAKPGKEIIVQLSHEWIIKNITKAVSRSVSNDILIKKQAVYSRHLFFSPLYHPSAADHAAAALSVVLTEKAHAHHDAFHYDEIAIKSAVNKRKERLRKKHGSQLSLAHEA